MMFTLLQRLARRLAADKNPPASSPTADLKQRLHFLKMQEEAANSETQLAKTDPDEMVRRLQRKYGVDRGNPLENDLFPEQRARP